MDAPARIAFLGTYIPRRCGIATFTRDLAAGMLAADESVKPLIVAVTDEGSTYDYAPDVEYEIRQGTKSNYARAAELVNYKAVRWVSLQHEYGIFGGDDGAYILDFLAALRVPAAVTLHTVLDTPSPSQRAIVQKMAKAAVLVVMSQVAADLLARRYELQGARVEIIPHGIPDMSPRDQEGLKARFGVAGQRMLLTFGLLGPNKGVETVIRALPVLVAAHSDLVYFVVGATHPAVLRQNGEAYRTSLERLAEQLGVREHVVFRDQYVTTEELCSYLQAADVFVSPYLNEAQVTSGALSYAMGAGSAVVSTPYWHAKELLSEGRGPPVCVWRQRRPGPHDRGAVRGSRGAWRACANAPTRTRAPSPGRRSASNTCGSGRRWDGRAAPARGAGATSRGRAACPSCASTTCCA